jgi:hypothetical protein
MVRFSGRVSPENLAIDISEVSVQVSGARGEFVADVVIRVSRSQVSAVITVLRGDADIATIRNFVLEVVQLEIDLFGYLEGSAYSVELNAVAEGEHTSTFIGVHIEQLFQDRDNRPIPFSPLIDLAMGDSALQHAVADFRQAIQIPRDTTFYCYRVIESIRHAFQTDDDPAPAWTRMRESLRLDVDSLQEAARAARGRRHGRPQEVTGEERVRAIAYAQSVIDRYVLFVKAGRVALQAEEYSLLRLPTLTT